MQRDIIEYVEGLAASWEPLGSVPKPEAALKELLRGRSVYEIDFPEQNLASYQPSLLSLPSSVEGCPRLEEVLLADARHFLEEYQERMLRTRDEVAALDALQPAPKS